MGMSIAEIGLYILTGIIVFGPLIPCGFQYYELLKTQLPKAFSLYGNFVVLISNLLQVMFWFGKDFDPAILASVVMCIVIVVGFTELNVRLERRQITSAKDHHSIWDSPISHFWHWTDVSSYLLAMLGITALMLLTTYAFQHSKLYFELIGYLGLVTEGIVAAPQAYRNYTRKSTKGLSLVTALLNYIGEFLKLYFYIIKTTPIQFYVCVAMQIALTTTIILQFVWYRKAKAEHAKV